jgi:HlyD family secretion protein
MQALVLILQMKKQLSVIAIRTGSLIKDHKVISCIIAVIIIAGGYYGYKKVNAQTASPRYVLGQVERGTLVSSISGTGQVSASNQLDIKPKVSGQITSVNVKSGQEVKAGTVLAQIDARDAAQSVRDAQADLTSAKISLEKTRTSSTVSRGDAQDALTKAYEDGYNTLSEVFTSYATIVDSADDILNSPSASSYMQTESVRSLAGNSGVERKNSIILTFEKVKAEYNQDYEEYKQLNRTSGDNQATEKLIADSYATSKKLADSLKDIRSFVAYLEGAASSVSTQMTSDKTSLDTNLATVNGKVTSLLALQSTIKDAKNSLATANQTYTAISGSDEPLDVQAARLTVTLKQNAYQKALNTLSDYTIRAPFDGVIAAANAKVGDNATSATVISTLITKQKVATVSLNEIDVAKVKIGDKATLTFDAVSGLTISGQVLDVDTIGTVSQGVVSYNVKIGFDTQDERIKPGMSVTAAIITDSKPNVLMVPTSAVKSDANGSYVEALDGVTAGQSGSQGITSASQPRQISIEVGSANDSQTEIVSGLNEGDQIITRTITGSAQTTTRTTNQRTGGNVLGVPTGGGARTNFGGGFQR